MLSFNPTTLAVFTALLSSIRAAPVTPSTSLSKRATGATIRPTNIGDVCLGVAGGLSNGALLSQGACTQGGGFYNQWDISPGDNQVVRLSGLPAGSGDWCLDAGLDFTSGNRNDLKIWQCDPGLPQQRWFYTDDLHLAVVGGNACAATNRDTGDVFTQYCFNADAIGGGSHGGGNPTIETFNVVGGNTPPPVVTGGRQIKWLEDGVERCLQVNNGAFGNGQSIGVNVCFTQDLSFYAFQNFVYNEGSTKIRVAPNTFTDTEFCIDFGTNLGANGQGLKIWQCYDGLPQQQLYLTGDHHIAVENRPGGGQCADVRAESGPEPVKPYGVRKQVQSWECSGGNPNQASHPNTPFSSTHY
ncbi:hypothetical protein QFC22_006030 [Naganishia vaughanmartiniae]|uniref:Uncharacterized protein n=1 Tax=Naganishia vaughanmartiniae TaxID=1424756 RepID=A0ACC2WQ15_9TREE|nr:hypothetical protein QFC22_006030 [Naganishia vaughanmartiniae]